MAHTFGITDLVSWTARKRDGTPGRLHTGRIASFHRMEDVPGTSARRLVRCAPADPNLSIVFVVDGISQHALAPWNTSWEGPSPLPHERILDDRRDDAAIVARGYVPYNAITSHAYPTLFQRHAPLTHHTRLRVRAWVQECRRRAQAWRPKDPA